jgi:hypothetical protein
MPQIDPVLGWMAAAAAAAIFVASGALKFYDLETFRGAVTNYHLLPESLATPFAWVVPVVECASALGLLRRGQSLRSQVRRFHPCPTHDGIDSTTGWAGNVRN